MASIVIKDLTESADLDRQAMRAIVGGARSSARGAIKGSVLLKSNRVFSYPSGVGSRTLTANEAVAGRKPGK